MAQSKTTPSYTELSEKLDKVVAALESPSVSIDDAMRLYEDGIKLTGELEKYLRTAENRIAKLKADVAES